VPSIPIALTIAGSDSGGGAGIQADLKTFQRFGVYGTSVITAVTAQNTQSVRAVQPISLAVVEAQLAALAEDLPPDAVKSGMLATGELVAATARAVAEYGWSPYVLDPVMVATSGDRLLDRDAEALIRDRLVPLATLVTPNLEEAAILTGLAVSDPAGMARAGRRLLELGARAALIKGGHLGGEEITDVLVTASGDRAFVHPRLATTSTHGTGCTLSAAITAGLADRGTEGRRDGGTDGRRDRGRVSDADLGEIVAEALAYLQRAIATAPGLGHGHGPVNHLA
jgi:hydroxymethylpyrimidine/phosphomethylpyrimidine kinase